MKERRDGGIVARAANVIMIRQMSGQLSRALLLFVTRTILQLPSVRNGANKDPLIRLAIRVNTVRHRRGNNSRTLSLSYLQKLLPLIIPRDYRYDGGLTSSNINRRYAIPVLQVMKVDDIVCTRVYKIQE